MIDRALMGRADVNVIEIILYVARAFLRALIWAEEIGLSAK